MALCFGRHGIVPSCSTPAVCWPRTCVRARAVDRANYDTQHTSNSCFPSINAQLTRRTLFATGAICSLALVDRVQAKDLVNTAQPLVLIGEAPAQVFFDVKLEDGGMIPLGRITIELFPDVGTAGQRFVDLAVGKEGVGYRLSKFDGILPTHIRSSGVKNLSYRASQESVIAGGYSLEYLEEELEKGTRKHTEAGLVSMIIKEKDERPVKERLIAKNGKLITIKEQAGEAPNGTAFTITLGPAPDLDGIALPIGRVVDGWETVNTIAAQPFNRPRESYYDKPFFETGKLIGDKRAIVAEKFFYRPFKRIIITSSGVMSAAAVVAAADPIEPEPVQGDSSVETSSVEQATVATKVVEPDEAGLEAMESEVPTGSATDNLGSSAVLDLEMLELEPDPVLVEIVAPDLN